MALLKSGKGFRGHPAHEPLIRGNYIYHYMDVLEDNKRNRSSSRKEESYKRKYWAHAEVPEITNRGLGTRVRGETVSNTAESNFMNFECVWANKPR